MPFNNLRSGTGPTDIPLGAPSGTNEQAEKQFAHRKGAVWHDTLKYPIDLEGQPFYPESIKFTVYRRHGASLKKIQQKVGDLANTLTNAFTSNKGPTKAQQEEITALLAAKTAENAERTNADILKLTGGDKNLFEVITGDAFTNFKDILKEGSAGLRQKSILDLEKETMSQLGSIYLNMPSEIAFADEVSWEGTDLGMVGGLTKGGTGGGAAIAGLFGNFSNVLGAGTGALASLALKLGSGGIAAGAVLGTLGGEAIQKGLESGTGQITNPYKEMTFSGIGFRNFSFNFVFRARNQTEVNAVQNIIKTFRYYSKPTYNTTLNSAGFLNYPQEFHIEFLTKYAPEDNFTTNWHIPQIKMCVCKGVTTNFSTQNTWRSLEGGAPVEIQLGLTFEETELVTGEDVIGETNIGRFKKSGRRF